MLGETDDPTMSIFLFQYKLDEPANCRNQMQLNNPYRMKKLGTDV
jgi:hypothetical protein